MKEALKKYSDRLETMKQNRANTDGFWSDAEANAIDREIALVAEFLKDLKAVATPPKEKVDSPSLEEWREKFDRWSVGELPALLHSPSVASVSEATAQWFADNVVAPLLARIQKHEDCTELQEAENAGYEKASRQFWESQEANLERLLEETGATNVASIDFQRIEQKWVISYKNGFPQDRFDLFSDVLEHLENA